MNNINYIYLLLLLIIFIIIYYIIVLKKKQENFKDLKDLKNSIDLDFLNNISHKIDKINENFDNNIILKKTTPKARCKCCNSNMHLYRNK